ncbi:two-component system response regulator protein [Bacteroidetes oral taxon 274 str. F0058]|nr:two-component system response regulator protein [Bacteroidetes oral taxon 274 str. F0058]
MEIYSGTNEHTLQCLVVDDEPIARQGIMDLIQRTDFLHITASCASAMEAIRFVETNKIDVIFLDINMPSMNGLEMLDKMKSPPIVIITTAYSEYAIEGYRLQVADYLLKPIEYNRFRQAALKALQIYRQRNIVEQQDNVEDRYIYVRQEGGFLRILQQDILYIRSMENYVNIKLTDRQFIVHTTMQSIEKVLDTNRFFRIHRSFLVNVRRIESISGGRVIIDGHSLPLSRRRKEELLKSIVYKNIAD